jgi:hypothetical protein
LSFNPRISADSATPVFRDSMKLPLSEFYVERSAADVSSDALTLSALVVSALMFTDSLTEGSTLRSTSRELNGSSFKYRSPMVRGVSYSPFLGLGGFFSEVKEDFLFTADLEVFFFFDFFFWTTGECCSSTSGKTVVTGSTLSGVVVVFEC